MASRALRDTAADRQLVEDGWAKLLFLEPSELEALQSLGASVQIESAGQLHVSGLSPDLKYRDRMRNEISSICAPAVERAFVEHRSPGGVFMVKPPGGYALGPHTDLDYVDEDRFRSFNVWVALSDVGLDSGAMQMVSGSHWIVPAGRGPTIPSPIREIPSDRLELYSIPVPLSPGEALIWDQRLIHGSLPNSTASPRYAVAVPVVPKDAPLIHHVNDGEGAVARYKVEDTFDPMPPRAELPSSGRRLRAAPPVKAQHMITAYGYGGNALRKIARGVRRRLLATRLRPGRLRPI